MLACPACGFENLPRSLICARCGGQLVWAGPTDSAYFQPPRAGRNKFFYQWRLFWRAHGPRPGWRPAFRLGDWAALVRAVPAAARQGWQNLPRRRREAVGLSLLPGLGQIIRGETTREIRLGLGLLGAWLAAWAWFWWILDGWPPSSLRLTARLYQSLPIWFTLAMLVHGYAAVAAARLDFHGRTNLEKRALALALTWLVWGLYLAGGWFLRQHLPVYLIMRPGA
ncbi:MAG: hypothetical protein LBV21_04940 [Candidatus Adiutrix sp.]|jgi:hypothetical protein|nr:hypothetical protein [Candidatus Adiutrix sp.]